MKILGNTTTKNGSLFIPTFYPSYKKNDYLCTII